jgi:hypothetical protein
MGDEPASFQSKNKPFRRSFIPTLEHFFLGKAIERDIQLYRVEIFRVKLKPLFLGKIRRIEGPVPPMRIIITARPDANHPLTLHLSPRNGRREKRNRQPDSKALGCARLRLEVIVVVTITSIFFHGIEIPKSHGPEDTP